MEISLRILRLTLLVVLLANATPALASVVYPLLDGVYWQSLEPASGYVQPGSQIPPFSQVITTEKTLSVFSQEMLTYFGAPVTIPWYRFQTAVIIFPIPIVADFATVTLTLSRLSDTTDGVWLYHVTNKTHLVSYESAVKLPAESIASLQGSRGSMSIDVFTQIKADIDAGFDVSTWRIAAAQTSVNPFGLFGASEFPGASPYLQYDAVPEPGAFATLLLNLSAYVYIIRKLPKPQTHCN